jgi:hypothetical protein
MDVTRKCARLLGFLICAAGLAAPALADDGDGAAPCFVFPGEVEVCSEVVQPAAGAIRTSDLSRPGSVIVFPLFIRGGGTTGICGAGNVLVDGVCLPRTEIELGATCPTRFTTGDQRDIPCPDHEPVRVRFRWVCPGIEDAKHRFICRTSGFDVRLTVNGKVLFTANGSHLPDTNQVHVPPAPCERGYLIGWVVNALGEPIKYDGLIGETVIRNSSTAAAAYRGITIQAEAATTPGSLIKLVPDLFDPKRLGLRFDGQPGQYRLITGQVTGDVTFDRPQHSAGSGFGTTSSLILLTLDVRSNSPNSNFPTGVALDFWNGFEHKLSTSVEFVCWGAFQLSADIDGRLTQAFMRTRKGIVQSSEAFKNLPGEVTSIFDVPGPVTLLGLIQTHEGPIDAPARSYIIELYNNGILFPPTNFFP